MRWPPRSVTVLRLGSPSGEPRRPVPVTSLGRAFEVRPVGYCAIRTRPCGRDGRGVPAELYFTDVIQRIDS